MRSAPTPSSTSSTSPSSARIVSPSSSFHRSSGWRIAARPAARSRRSRRRTFPNMPGTRALRRSSRASVSSRSETRTFTRRSPARSWTRIASSAAASASYVNDSSAWSRITYTSRSAWARSATSNNPPRSTPAGPARAVGERSLGIVGPGGEHDDERLLGQIAKRSRDAREQKRRLSDTARPVEHGQARRNQVGDDDLRVALASEEVEGVDIGVRERRQPAVGRRNAHAASSRRRASSSTYASGSTSRTSTSKRRQNARSSAVGCGSTAHDR